MSTKSVKLHEQEQQAIEQLFTNINDKKLKDDSIKKKKNTICEKNCCTAAVRYITIGNAYRDILKNIPVYFVKDENGKSHAYSRCSKTTHDGKDFCHIHTNTFKNNGNIKIFEKDILPKDAIDKNRWLADVNDDYFQEMGKRGAKKKNCENNYTFSESNDPILLTLNHKNAKLATLLRIYASQLLKTNGNPSDVELHMEKEYSKLVPKKPQHSIKNEETLDNLISMITTNVEVEKDDTESVFELTSDITEDYESYQESVSCIPIYTKDKQELWYNPDNNIVYQMCDENGDGSELGELKEISKEYYTIKHNKKYYTVITPYELSFKCVFTNALFDIGMNFTGFYLNHVYE